MGRENGTQSNEGRQGPSQSQPARNGRNRLCGPCTPLSPSWAPPPTPPPGGRAVVPEKGPTGHVLIHLTGKPMVGRKEIGIAQITVPQRAGWAPGQTQQPRESQLTARRTLSCRYRSDLPRWGWGASSQGAFARCARPGPPLLPLTSFSMADPQRGRKVSPPQFHYMPITQGSAVREERKPTSKTRSGHFLGLSEPADYSCS